MNMTLVKKVHLQTAYNSLHQVTFNLLSVTVTQLHFQTTQQTTKHCHWYTLKVGFVFAYLFLYIYLHNAFIHGETQSSFFCKEKQQMIVKYTYFPYRQITQCLVSELQTKEWICSFGIYSIHTHTHTNYYFKIRPWQILCVSFTKPT